LPWTWCGNRGPKVETTPLSLYTRHVGGTHDSESLLQCLLLALIGLTADLVGLGLPIPTYGSKDNINEKLIAFENKFFEWTKSTETDNKKRDELLSYCVSIGDAILTSQKEISLDQEKLIRKLEEIKEVSFQSPAREFIGRRKKELELKIEMAQNQRMYWAEVVQILCWLRRMNNMLQGRRKKNYLRREKRM